MFPYLNANIFTYWYMNRGINSIDNDFRACHGIRNQFYIPFFVMLMTKLATLKNSVVKKFKSFVCSKNLSIKCYNSLSITIYLISIQFCPFL